MNRCLRERVSCSSCGSCCFGCTGENFSCGFSRPPPLRDQYIIARRVRDPIARNGASGYEIPLGKKLGWRLSKDCWTCLISGEHKKENYGDYNDGKGHDESCTDSRLW